jgi:hypothetical protein
VRERFQTEIVANTWHAKDGSDIFTKVRTLLNFLPTTEKADRPRRVRDRDVHISEFVSSTSRNVAQGLARVHKTGRNQSFFMKTGPVRFHQMIRFSKKNLRRVAKTVFTAISPIYRLVSVNLALGCFRF